MAIKATILVVEDDADARDLVSLSLTQKGYAVITAGDGAAGLNAAVKKRPDLILLDIMLPGMDGWQVLENVRSRPVNKGVPVFMLSALNEVKNVDRATEMGATGYITKPFDIARILLKVERALAARANGAVPSR